tara:strand:+ start:18 stop:608 length:591 start_codon:yes stop_codon:yes gene_type:complete
MSFDYLFKFIVIGDARVGKTSYCLRLTHDQFVHEECNTIGVEFSTSVFNIGGNIIKCQFWDTAGCERFRAITRSYYRGVTAAIMVFDLSNTESFKSLEKWKKELLNNAEDDLHVLVVGTKTDKKPKVKMEDILKFVESNNYEYTEVSSRTGSNVKQSFLFFLEHLILNLSNLEYWKSKPIVSRTSSEISNDCCQIL